MLGASTNDASAKPTITITEHAIHVGLTEVGVLVLIYPEGYTGSRGLVRAFISRQSDLADQCANYAPGSRIENGGPPASNRSGPNRHRFIPPFKTSFATSHRFLAKGT